MKFDGLFVVFPVLSWIFSGCTPINVTRPFGQIRPSKSANGLVTCLFTCLCYCCDCVCFVFVLSGWLGPFVGSACFHVPQSRTKRKEKGKGKEKGKAKRSGSRAENSNSPKRKRDRDGGKEKGIKGLDTLSTYQFESIRINTFQTIHPTRFDSNRFNLLW